MNRLLDDDDDLLQQRDRELTLSTGAILAIFLGLVLLCAIFFGFGYNLGHKASPVSPPVVTAEPSAPASATPTNFNSFKPSPSSVASSSPAAASTGRDTAATAPDTASPQPASRPETPPAAKTTRTVPPVASPAPHESVVPPHTVAPPPAHPSAATTPPPSVSTTTPPATAAPAGAFVVQIAAVSRKDDADLLVSALHAKGYDVVARPGSQDKLLHIQVGPFATRKDAEAMREKLIIDGYNAIVK